MRTYENKWWTEYLRKRKEENDEESYIFKEFPLFPYLYTTDVNVFVCFFVLGPLLGQGHEDIWRQMIKRIFEKEKGRKDEESYIFKEFPLFPYLYTTDVNVFVCFFVLGPLLGQGHEDIW